MAQYDANAEPKPKDQNEYVAHQFHVNAHWDANLKQITLTVEDAITKKKWEKVVKENECEENIKSVYDKITKAVDTSKMACAFPDENKPLDLVLMTQPQYLAYELPEI